MPDFLVRNVPADTLAVYKARAAANGNSAAAEMRAALVNEATHAAHAAAGKWATQAGAEGRWPTDLGEGMATVRGLIMGYLHAISDAMANGVGDDVLMATLTGAAPDAVTPTVPRTPAPAAPAAPDQNPALQGRIVSRRYDIVVPA